MYSQFIFARLKNFLSLYKNLAIQGKVCHFLGKTTKQFHSKFSGDDVLFDTCSHQFH